MERTLVLVKPDGVQRNLIGTIINRLERRGLNIAAMKMLQMDRPLAERHYAVHKGKVFYEGLVKFIISGPLVAMVLEGREAVAVVRKTIGETDPAKAAPGTIRADLCMDTGRNLVHASDSVENAGKEIALFFSSKEIMDYTLDVDRWVNEPK